MNDITYEEIEEIRYSVCDGCKGAFYIHETGCYERCEPFQEELKEMRGGGMNDNYPELILAIVALCVLAVILMVAV